MDGSGSVGVDNFEVVKSWVQTVSRRFNINDGSTQIGVIQYSFIQATRYHKSCMLLRFFLDKKAIVYLHTV